MCCPSPHKNQQSRQQRQNTHLMIDKAVIDHLPGNIEDHHQSYIGDPTIALDISRDNIGGDAHQSDRKQQSYDRSEEHTPELKSLMRIPIAFFSLKKKTNHISHQINNLPHNN